jgi:hypothetical protein
MLLRIRLPLYLLDLSVLNEFRCMFLLKDVIEATAKFLETGKLPKKATRLGLVN